jgi:hypothetical protein
MRRTVYQVLSLRGVLLKVPDRLDSLCWISRAPAGVRRTVQRLLVPLLKWTMGWARAGFEGLRKENRKPRVSSAGVSPDARTLFVAVCLRLIWPEPGRTVTRSRVDPAPREVTSDASLVSKPTSLTTAAEPCAGGKNAKQAVATTRPRTRRDRATTPTSTVREADITTPGNS